MAYLTLAVLGLCTIGQAIEPPNIVLFVVDDLGIGDVGSFGNDSLRTPYIDSICKNGVKLEHDLASAALCTPSRAAMMTSRYAVRSGMSHVIMSLMVANGLPRSEWTLPQMLKQEGYATALIGKWHLGWNRGMLDQYFNPINYGFNHFFGLPTGIIKDIGGKQEIIQELGGDAMLMKIMGICLITSGLMAYFLSKRIGITMALMSVGFIGACFVMLKTNGITNATLVRNDRIIEMPANLTTITRRLIDEGQSFVKTQRAKREPFFLEMSWLHVHTFLHPQPPFKGSSKHGPYGDAVEETDWAIGQIMKTLEELGISDDTLIYFTSDHGGDKTEIDEEGRMVGGWNGIFRGGKIDGGQEGAIRVPTCIQWPSGLTKGKVISEPTSHMDLMPTIAAIVGRHMPKDRHIDGKSILPLLTGEEKRTPHDFFFHYKETELMAIRHRPREGDAVYKLHYVWPGWQPGTDTWPSLLSALKGKGTVLKPPRLFNVVADPKELNPLDTKVEPYAGIVKKIEEARLLHEESLVGSVPSIQPGLSQFFSLHRSVFVDYAWQYISDEMDKAWHAFNLY